MGFSNLHVTSADGSGKGAWQLPSMEHLPGETIRETAERAAFATLGEGPKLYFVGNAPAGHFPDRSPLVEAVAGGRRGRQSVRDRQAQAIMKARADAADAAESAESAGVSTGAAESVGSEAEQGEVAADDGCTTFYVKAQLITGEITGMKKGSGWYDYAWVTAEEVPQYFDNPSQQKFLDEML